MNLVDFFLLLVIIITLVEFFFAGIILPFYYRKGIPIYKNSIQLQEEFTFSIDSVLDDLFSKFYPFRIFYIISDTEIAFKKNNLYSLIPGTSIVFGLIKFEYDKQKITFTGYFNWFILSIFCFFILSILINFFNISHLIHYLRLLVLGIFIYFFIVKYKLKSYRKIFKYLENKYSKS